MQLTTEYQKLSEAYLGSSSGNLYIRIYAKYSEQDIPNNRTKVQYQARAYFSGNYIYDQQSSGNVKGTGANQVNYSKSSNYNNGETTLGTTEGWVVHNSDGTMSITASAYLTFPNWNWRNTATGTATLPTLHKAPNITNCAITAENNNQLRNLGLATGTIAQYLSNKTFTITPELFDSATLSNWSIYHNNVLIGTSTTSTIQINFANVSELQTTVSSGTHYVGFVVTIKDSKNGTNSKNFNFPVIKYTRPSIEMTSTSIKRKTGGGTTLTQNLAVLNFKGTCYKGNDVIGNNNTPLVRYKIWNSSEPSYTNLTTPSSANITISNFQISNISYLKTWNYKIRISDSFITTDASPYVKTDKVPTGVSVWSEYKNRVDFLELTVNNYNPFEYSANEIRVGIWNEGNVKKPIYRKVYTITRSSSPTSGWTNFADTPTNLQKIIKMQGMLIEASGNMKPTPHFESASSELFYEIYIARIDIHKLAYQSTYSGGTSYVILEYTKTTD